MAQKESAQQDIRGLSRSSRMVLGLLVLSAVTTGIGVVVGASGRQTAEDALQAAQQLAQEKILALQTENERLRSEIERAEALVRDLTRQLDSTYTAVEVGGAVDFPVLRGMARQGDTVAAFAAREGSTVDILKALNPWLKDRNQGLANRQTLWIPKPASKP